MDPFWNSHLLCYWGSHHIFGFISRHVSFRFIWSWILKWFWEERIEPNLEWMNTFMLRLCCWNEADVSSVGIWTLLIFSCTSCSFSQLRIIVDETFNCLLNPLSLKMPPKGDVVTENEIQLSSMIGRYSNYFKARWTHHLWESTCSQLSRMLVSVDESQVDFSECFVHPIRTGVDRCRKAQRTSFYWSNEGRYYWRMEMWTRAADSSSFLVSFIWQVGWRESRTNYASLGFAILCKWSSI